MEISIKPLGAGQEVGRSCILVKINGFKILLDCGVHMGFNDDRKFPDFKRLLKKNKSKESTKTQQLPLSSKDNNSSSIFKNIEDTKNDYTNVVDLLIISHFHLDHCGALPYFTELLGYKGPILCTQPTKAILPVTLEDFRKIMGEYRGEKSLLLPEQITECVRRIQTIEVGETRVFNEKIKVTCFYAGHVLGAAMFHIDIDGYTVAYTGDYNTICDRHLAGAYMPKIYPDVLMTETTYGDKVRDTKRVREREFLKKIQETIDKGGKVLIPIFALGRAQELCIVLDTYWKRTNCQVPIYFAGPMAKKANFYYKLFQNWMNSTVKNLFISNNVFDFKFVKQGDKTLMKGNKPMVIFATPGMLHGGLSLSIFKEIAPDPKNCVIIPGYCSAGTVGNRILSGEKVIEIDKTKINVNCEVYYMSFSAHADAKGLLQLIKNVQPRNVMLVHGDYEIMKHFKKTCEEKMDVPVLTPGNYDRVQFKDDNEYYQIDISKSLFNILRCLYKMESIKSKKKGKVKIRGINLRENLLDITKVSLFPKGAHNLTIRNKIGFLSKSNSFDEFLQFISMYFKSVYNDYIELKGRDVIKISYDDSKKKILFGYQWKIRSFDDQSVHRKILKIVKIYTRYNKITNI